nr:MBOAT family O-acyltransferase [Flavobacterium selenitireducens]
MAIGYTIDVYNEELEAEKNIGIVALFVSFFPLVLSGPIERAGNMLPQFRSPEKLAASNLSKGLKLMLWGYFMKLVVADRLGIYIDEVYSDTASHNGSSYLIAMTLYPFQLYGDLGGYSLIAIGAAKAMGFNVMMNFRRPFFSVSMSEFWRRWHISLITWITDYIYTPLSFSFRKHGKWGIVIALLLAFLISGIWHGASLTFVAWGLLQGIFLSVEAYTVKSRADFRHRFGLGKQAWFIALSCIFTFSLFAISQVFARSSTLSESFTVFAKLVSDHGNPYVDFSNLTIGLGFLALLMLSDFRDEFLPGKFRIFDNRSFAVRFLAYLAIFFCIVIFGVVSDQFIYFNF